MSEPLAIDLFCGLGGWTDGLLAEGYDVVGFDIERHDYGTGGYPAQLVLQDVLTLHGRQFKDAALIVASPPCQEFSYMAMPWSRSKRIAQALFARKLCGDGPSFPDGYAGSSNVAELTALFDACFRIQREACEAAGRHIPMIVENVRGAIPWVGRSRWNYGSYHLWGDVPALMPMTKRLPFKGGDRNMGRDTGEHKWNTEFKVPGFRFDGSGKSFQTASVDGLKLPGNNSPDRWCDREIQRLKDCPVEGMKNTGGQWFGIDPRGNRVEPNNPVSVPADTGFKSHGLNWSDRSIKGQDFTRVAGKQAADHLKHGGDCFNDPAWAGKQGGVSHKLSEGWRAKQYDKTDKAALSDHVKQSGIGGTRNNGKGDAWFQDGAARSGSKSKARKARKAASAAIAKIPFALSSHIARVYKPDERFTAKVAT